MNAKTTSLAILALSLPCTLLLPRYLFFPLVDYLVVEAIEAILFLLIIPALGGFLAGWQWGLKGAPAALLYLLSALMISVLYIIGVLPSNPLEPGSEFFVLIPGAFGTIIAFIGVLAGWVFH